MAQAQAVEQEEVIDIVPGTEGTEFEGLSEEDIERKLFADEVSKDPDIDGKIEVVAPEEEAEETAEKPEVQAEPEAEEKTAESAPEEAKAPTGLEWIDELPEDKREIAKQFIDRQGQTIARLDQRVKSHLGQLRPTQRAVSQLQQKIRQQNELLGKLQQSTTNPDVEKTIKSYHDWVDQNYKEFPEEADKLKKQFTDSLDGVKHVLRPATPAQQAPNLPGGPNPKDEVQHLATAYSDWGERRFSPEFGQWLAQQPQEIKTLLNSPFAADNIALLDAFTNDNPDWESPQTPDQFYSLKQAQYSPLFRGWAEGEGINPDFNTAAIPDFERDRLLTRFKTDLGTVLNEQAESEEPVTEKLAERRKQQLKDRQPGSRRAGIALGKSLDLDTEEGQRALFEQMVKEDPDLR